MLDKLFNFFLFGYTSKSNRWTVIHGKTYDLSHFDHPGGASALSLAYGRDSTVLFESYHVLNDLPLKRLKNMKKLPALHSDINVENLDWEDEFAFELKSLCRDYFAEKKLSPYASFSRLFLIFLFFLLFLVSGYFYYTGWWFSLLLFPFASWLFGVNVQHDASHRALFRIQWMNDVAQAATSFFSSPFMWAHQHVIGHHSFPNTAQDPDLRHGSYVWRYHPNAKYNWWYRYQLAYVFYFWSLSVLALAFAWDAFSLRSGIYRKTVVLKRLSKISLVLHLLERAFCLSVVFFLPFVVLPLHKALIWGATWYLVLGFIFTAISQVNHVSPSVLLSHDRRWYRSQVVTALNYAQNSTLTFYITGGLNFQIEHHLFPGVNHEHLPGLSKGVRELCSKYNVSYSYVDSYWTALLLHVDVIVDTSRENC